MDSSNGDDTLEMAIHQVAIGNVKHGYQPLKIRTSRGEIACRLYEATDSAGAAIFVGGTGGGWDTPADGLYPKLARALVDEGISALRIRYRFAKDLEEAVLDVIAGIVVLEDQGVERIALVGHSFGGAVVIRAALAVESVRTVVTLATQSRGTEGVGELAPACSLLLLHGTADKVLPAASSEHVYSIAREPKELRNFEGAGHSLDEVAPEVFETVGEWILGQIGDDDEEIDEPER
jgi:pimeloyl-ACP methyl ester carboxylesterase